MMILLVATSGVDIAKAKRAKSDQDSAYFAGKKPASVKKYLPQLFVSFFNPLL